MIMLAPTYTLQTPVPVIDEVIEHIVTDAANQKVTHQQCELEQRQAMSCSSNPDGLSADELFADEPSAALASRRRPLRHGSIPFT